MMTVLFLPFQIFKLFVSFSSLNALARISNTMVIQGILVSFPISGGKLLSMILGVYFFYRYLLYIYLLS